LSAVPQIPALVKNAKEKGYTSIALTDEDSGAGLVEFYEVCKKNDINPVLGATLRITNISSEQGSFGKTKNLSKIAILAKDEIGYKSLLSAITTARTIREKPNYHLTFEDLKNLSVDNIFVVVATVEHELGALIKNNQIDEAEKLIKKYLNIIPKTSLIVELLIKLNGENAKTIETHNKKLVELLDKFEIPSIYSPAPRYLETEDEESFKTVLAVRDGKRLVDIQLNRSFELPSVNLIKEKFEHFESSINTQSIEEKINIEVRFDYDKYASEAFFPIFELPQNQTAASRLKYESYIGLITTFSKERNLRSEWKEKYPFELMDKLIEDVKKLDPEKNNLEGYPQGYWNENKIQKYIERIEYEIDIIVSKGYPDYFLVFGDIMQFCRDNQIVINTRGSAAGSLVGFLNNINILDPLIYNLPFERFLNPYRPSAPDIDGDFADDRRQEVIDYIVKKYGKDKVCQIITFGTMLPRAAVRDVGRALGVSYKKCDRLSKLIPIAPQGKKTSFKWAFETSSELTQVYQRDEECKRIIDIAKKIEGNFRHASVHAAGVIIAPKSVWEFAPLQWDSEHETVICQYDMRFGEKAGLIKMDILGIRNLAILGNALEIAQKRSNTKIDLLRINTRDKKSFDLLAKGRTMGTFQLSGPAMTKYLVDLAPTKVQDLMAMVALYRPGPMASIPEYILRKKDPKKVKYLVPQMKDWMGESYGLFVYQEDVLFTAIELAGYNWGEADVIRKGLGKKIQSVIDQEHPKFVDGCVKKSNIPKEKAEEIWSLIVPFAAYGFNKAHSSSYGMIAYWTAYMKANYTVEFMTALMTAESNNLDKIASAIKECEELGIRVLPPDINKSQDGFSIESNKIIRYGLGSVKNLGSDVIKYIINERSKNGDFKSMENFLERISSYQGFNRRSMEALIWSGALDSLALEIITKLKENHKLKTR
jgi:DNA polymerase-3 subunit alpha